MEHEIKILSGLLVKYANTEAPSNGSIEARILTFHEQNKDNLNKVTSMTLGRSRTQSKNKLVMALLDHVEASGFAASIPDSFMYRVLLLSRTGLVLKARVRYHPTTRDASRWRLF